MKLQAKKSLGQHFLNSTHVLEQIVGAAAIKPGEKILEIGPGMGILTTELLKSGAHVIAVEKDDRAIEILKEKFVAEIREQRLELVHGDILDPHLAALHSLSNTSYALVANIPYYITGAILEKFLEHEPRPNRMVLLVQKEVADRIIAREGKESILSISVKAFGEPNMIAKVPRGAFTPPPNVDSAILAIENVSDARFSSEKIDIRRFFEVLRAGFSHKRKFLARNLEAATDSGTLKTPISTIWSTLNLDPKVRAEDITVDDWVKIVKCE